MYEEDIRVPLWVRGPGIEEGTTVTELLGNVDLAPTFCEIAGIMPLGLDRGRAFVPAAAQRNRSIGGTST